MSAFGHKQTFCSALAVSALPSKASANFSHLEFVALSSAKSLLLGACAALFLIHVKAARDQSV